LRYVHGRSAFSAQPRVSSPRSDGSFCCLPARSSLGSCHSFDESRPAYGSRLDIAGRSINTDLPTCLVRNLHPHPVPMAGLLPSRIRTNLASRARASSYALDPKTAISTPASCWINPGGTRLRNPGSLIIGGSLAVRKLPPCAPPGFGLSARLHGLVPGIMDRCQRSDCGYVTRRTRYFSAALESPTCESRY
jgi:hypothetical protein